MSGSLTPPGWVPVADAATKMGRHPNTLRKDIAAGLFTRLRKSNRKTADLYIPQAELDAFLAGGIDAVLALRSAPVAAGA